MLVLAQTLVLVPWLMSGASAGVVPLQSSSASSTQSDLLSSVTIASSTTLLASSTLSPSAPTSTSAVSPSATLLPSSSLDSTVVSSSLASSSGFSSVSESSSSLSLSLSTSASASQPSQTSDPSTLADLETVRERRLSLVVEEVAVPSANVSTWLSTLGDNGKWPDSEIDYTTGCPARRANWPAREHWVRIAGMAAAWHGTTNGTQSLVNSSTLLDAISRAMDYWFMNDFTNPNCLDSGGLAACPCGTPGFWNTNWFSNIIGVPDVVGSACLLVGHDTLSATQLSNCTNILQRSFGTFDRHVNGLGTLTGANTLDVAKIGIDSGLLNNNASVVADGYRRIHKEVVVQNAIKADGIRADGSFGQHGGLIYNGNYGKDYANDVIGLEIAAAGTQYSAQNAGTGSQAAFESLLDGDLWMIYRNVLTVVLPQSGVWVASRCRS